MTAPPQLSEGEQGYVNGELDRIARQLGCSSRDELLQRMRGAAEVEPPAAENDGKEFAVRIAGAPIPTNAAYAPVAFRLKGTSKWVARIRLTGEGESFRDLVRAQVLRARQFAAPRWSPGGKHEVRIVYDFASPLSDIDGPIKLTLDALQGVVYNNDRQVSHLDVWRRVNTMHPGVEITLRRLRDGLPEQKDLQP